MAPKAKTKTITRYVKKATRRARRFTIPIAAVLGFAPSFSDAWANARGPGGVDLAARIFTRSFTAFDPLTGVWSISYLRRGLFPVLAGIAVHKFIGGSLGINRMLGSSGVPLIRL